MSTSSPSWERSLALSMAAYKLAVSGYQLVGNPQPVEAARLEVVAAIDRAIAEGVPEPEVDRVLERLTGG